MHGEENFFPKYGRFSVYINTLSDSRSQLFYTRPRRAVKRKDGILYNSSFFPFSSFSHIIENSTFFAQTGFQRFAVFIHLVELDINDEEIF